MKIKDWKKFQHYDKRKPPWIKLHKGILDDIRAHKLSDGAFRFLINLILLASEEFGNLPDIEEISFRLRIDISKVNSYLKEIDYCIESCDSKVLADCKQNGVLEKEKEVDLKKIKKPLSSKKNLAQQVLDYLNEKADRKYKPTDTNLKFILARFKEEYDIDDLKWVIDYKVAEWKNGDMDMYLRPATLFNATKFNQYIGVKGIKEPGTDKKWYETSTGIIEKGKELELNEDDFDNFPAFKNAVFEKLNKKD